MILECSSCRIEKKVYVLKEKLEKLKTKSNAEQNEILVAEVRKKNWYERYRWFFTSDGMLAIGKSMSIMGSMGGDGGGGVNGNAGGEGGGIGGEEAAERGQKEDEKRAKDHPPPPVFVGHRADQDLQKRVQCVWHGHWKS